MNCKKLKFKTISEFRKALKKVNGCGSGFFLAWPFRIPKWINNQFTKCCDIHDMYYQKHMPKDISDDILYNCWYEEAHRHSGIKKKALIKLADFGYWCLNTKLSEWCYKAAKGGK